MSLFPSTLTGRILDDGVTEPPVIELHAGHLRRAARHSPHRLYPANGTHGPHRGHRSQRCSHRGAAGPGGRPARISGPDTLRFGGGPRRPRGLHPRQRFRLGGVNTSLTQGLAGKANQSALDALQVEVNLDLKLANHSTTAAMNSSITQRQQQRTGDCCGNLCAQKRRGPAGPRRGCPANTALLPMASTSDLNAAVALRTTPTDVSQLIATALLPALRFSKLPSTPRWH